MPVLLACRIQALLGQGGFHPDFKEDLREQARDPERAAHEAVGMKPRAEWRAKDLRNTRNVGFPWMETAQESCWGEGGRLPSIAQGWGFSTPLKLTPYHLCPDSGRGAAGLKYFSFRIWSYEVFSAISIPIFCNEHVYPMPSYLEMDN